MRSGRHCTKRRTGHQRKQKYTLLTRTHCDAYYKRGLLKSRDPVERVIHCTNWSRTEIWHFCFHHPGLVGVSTSSLICLQLGNVLDSVRCRTLYILVGWGDCVVGCMGNVCLGLQQKPGLPIRPLASGCILSLFPPVGTVACMSILSA